MFSEWKDTLILFFTTFLSLSASGISYVFNWNEVISLPPTFLHTVCPIYSSSSPSQSPILKVIVCLFFDYYYLIHTHTYWYISMYMYIYTTCCVCSCCVCIISGMNTLHWTINEWAHPWQRLIVLFPSLSYSKWDYHMKPHLGTMQKLTVLQFWEFSHHIFRDFNNFFFDVKLTIILSCILFLQHFRIFCL